MSEIWAGMRLFMADNKEIVPFISSVTALVAVFVGPMIQFRIAKIQHTANVVSGNRVRWIEEFRSEIAEFCTSMHFFELHKKSLESAEQSEEEKIILYYIQEGDKSLFNANRLLYKLRMKLNRGKKIEAEIYNVLGEIDKLELEKMEFDEFHKILFSKTDTLNYKTAEFLREEWKKITKLR